MITVFWETIKRAITDLIEWLVILPKLTASFDGLADPIGELCQYCGSCGVSMSGYCVGCGLDRGARQPQDVVANITDSFVLGSRIEIVVAE